MSGRMEMDGELNPNHPTTEAVSGQWHKFLAVLTHKLGYDHLVISPTDVEEFLSSGFAAVTVKDGEDGDQCMHFRLVTAEEAERLAREEGGLPA